MTNEPTRVERLPAGNGTEYPFVAILNNEMLRTRAGVGRRFKTEAAAWKALQSASPDGVAS